MYNVSFRPIDVCYCKEFWLATAWFLGGLLNHFKSGKELSTFFYFNTHASSYCPSRFSISSDLNYYTGWLFCLFPQLLELGLHHSHGGFVDICIIVAWVGSGINVLRCIKAGVVVACAFLYLFPIVLLTLFSRYSPSLACLYRISNSTWELLLVGGNLIKSQNPLGERMFIASSCT
jgi:hypothetical protein